MMSSKQAILYDSDATMPLLYGIAIATSIKDYVFLYIKKYSIHARTFCTQRRLRSTPSGVRRSLLYLTSALLQDGVVLWMHAGLDGDFDVGAELGGEVHHELVCLELFGDSLMDFDLIALARVGLAFHAADVAADADGDGLGRLDAAAAWQMGHSL